MSDCASQGTDIVELIRSGWLSWQKAMAGGWVEEWVDVMCDDEVVLCDYFTTKKPFVGKEEICHYYNKLVNKTWGKGCIMTWHPLRFEAEGDDTVVCEYDVCLTHPSGNKNVTRHRNTFKVSEANKITTIAFKQIPMTGDPVATGNGWSPNFIVEKEVNPAPPEFIKQHNEQQNNAPDKPTTFIHHGWQTWQRAMAGGWVGEWLTAFCTDDVVFQDRYLPGKEITVVGVSNLVDHYNMLLDKWGVGSNMCWKARSFTEMSPTTVTTEYDITLKDSRGKVRNFRQVYLYKIDGRRLAEVQILPRDTIVKINNSSSASIGSNSSIGYSSSSAPSVKSGDEEPTSSNQPSPSQPNSGERVVQLERPCNHNSWDNVRIKRGWLVLRCRLCHSQWRQRPTEITRCSAFSEGNCPNDTRCPNLHIHHIKHTKAQRDQAKNDIQLALDFLCTTQGISVVAALCLASTSSIGLTKNRRRTNTASLLNAPPSISM
eukprot:TRINITY_DN23269_c0_g1_i1.p1 TRINITY_DN23269_c0_g1~~TRINITY_DN23269_c0_g1_i1.p1  ORF type:complete len:502 (+),score=70.29 TRINITY_DN23269_c0_g1_i1:50-1507(+)